MIDFPEAWRITRATPMGEHNPNCSYVQTNRALLCDCYVLLRESLKDAEKERDSLRTVGKLLTKALIHAEGRLNMLPHNYEDTDFALIREAREAATDAGLRGGGGNSVDD